LTEQKRKTLKFGKVILKMFLRRQIVMMKKFNKKKKNRSIINKEKLEMFIKTNNT